MSAVNTVTLQSGSISATLTHPGAELPVPDFSTTETPLELARHALQNSLEFPPLKDCVFPGDRVAIVPDLETAELPEMLAAIVEVLSRVPDEGVSPVIILPPDPDANAWDTLRSCWPDAVKALPVALHDPSERTQVSYVASTAAGERIYINREAAEADVLITVGGMRFDSVFGVRGVTSAVFPGLADTETIRQTGFDGGDRYRPEYRETRQKLVEEITGFLGTQYSLQLIPGPQGPRRILAGTPAAVFAAGLQLLEEIWTVRPKRRAELVVISVNASQPFAWSLLAETLEKVAAWVEDGGRLAAIVDVPVPSGPAAELIRRTNDPMEAARVLRRQPLPDGVEMLRLLEVSQRARVFVLSRLPEDLAEELGLFPLTDESELQRLSNQASRCVVLPNAAALRPPRWA
jgi:hypothetical protein